MKTIPFAKRLRKLLGNRTNAWLVATSGISPPQISRLLRGVRSPTDRSLTAIAAALEISMDDLVSGTDAADKAASPFVPRVVPRDQFDRVMRDLRATQDEVVALRTERNRLLRQIEQLRQAKKRRRTS